LNLCVTLRRVSADGDASGGGRSSRRISTVVAASRHRGGRRGLDDILRDLLERGLEFVGVLPPRVPASAFELSGWLSLHPSR
jgi:hypothetical protein